jgi:hypothetical protein
MVKIEEGKFYKTREGRKVGPMKWEETGKSYVYPKGGYWRADQEGTWWPDGSYYKNREAQKDIISEWPSEDNCPIREIRRREIVPGVYGIVDVRDKAGSIYIHAAPTADQLREAAHLFNQLAEFLDGEGE